MEAPRPTCAKICAVFLVFCLGVDSCGDRLTGCQLSEYAICTCDFSSYFTHFHELFFALLVRRIDAARQNMCGKKCCFSVSVWA